MENSALKSAGAAIADCHVHTRFVNYETTQKMLLDIEEVGVKHVCLLPLPYRSAAENLFGLFVKNFYKRISVRTFGGLHVTDRYSLIPPEEQVRALLDLGCDGIKLMFSPDLRGYYGRGIDDPYYDAMLSLLEERDVPVNLHLADPETFWNAGQPYAGGAFISKENLYLEGLRMLDKHPRLRVCFAHFMFLSNFPDEAERIMEKYPNVMFDLTPGVEMYYNFDKQLDRWRDFFEKYKDRILFGTDCNAIKKCNKELELLVYGKLTERGEYSSFCYGRDIKVMGLGLSADAVSKISYENYFKFLGREPAEVNKDMLLLCCQRIIRDLQKEPYDECYIRGGELIPDLRKDPEQKIAYDFCKMAIERLENDREEEKVP